MLRQEAALGDALAAQGRVSEINRPVDHAQTNAGSATGPHRGQAERRLGVSVGPRRRPDRCVQIRLNARVSTAQPCKTLARRHPHRKAERSEGSGA